MKLNIKYNFGDFYEAQKFHYSTSKHKCIILAGGLLMIIISFSGGYSLSSLLFLSMGLLFVFYSYTFLLLSSYRWFKQSEYLHTKNEIMINNNGIHIKNSMEDSKVSWNGFIKQKSNKKVLLLYRTPYSIRIIPKRIMQEKEWVKILALTQKKIKSSEQ